MYNEDISPIDIPENAAWLGLAHRLFVCTLHTSLDSFSMFIRSNTHYEAALLLVCYAREDKFITDFNDITDSAIDVFEVPGVEGSPGSVESDEVSVVLVPVVGLL